ncbi:hemicentin-1-like [Mytilus californianus]|uniref:hemicentin-1-like n=1 Tax=Mytilus californianus TaxID=6549 RepID=UPI0022453191|nr:hemicentin-1-like [Mytilus californianus]XP_052062341.1 hemicentin-1-like [Mytilus californianus]XP_052062342.1 hemicentin-1-like [Mytilus californianus]XP_052062344.1 hemicentin-1-like [Mytilus californianus]XP_052062345.1 hemicentin-1-like [Mytilus californianus]XP_052062346.1 hemicentin-1-like [Mytilus californianus]
MVILFILIAIQLLVYQVLGCVETFPVQIKSNTVCSNQTRTCTESCVHNQLFYDGNSTKTYECIDDDIWSPPVPGNGCLDRTPATFWMRFEVDYKTTGIALYCLDAHRQALEDNRVTLEKQVSYYCNNPVVSVGDISINRTVSRTSSFVITTVFYIEIGDTFTTESNKDACSLLLQLNVNSQNLLVYGSTLVCSTGTSNINKTSASVNSDMSSCPELHVLVVDNNGVDYCVVDTPVIGVESFTYTANISQDVTLYCELLFGTQVTGLYWQQDNQNLTAASFSDKYSSATKEIPSLTIRNVTYDDAGTYSCHAVNYVGTGSSPDIQLNVIARVEDIPDVYILEPKYYVTAGNNVTINCSVSAFPSVHEVKWTRNVSGVIEFISSDYQEFQGSTTTSPSLTILFADLSDGGIYICMATNAAGTGRSSPTSLHVLGDKPTVQIPEESYTPILGNNVTIKCNYSSDPPATSIQWNYNVSGNFIDINLDKDKYSGSTTIEPSLSIFNISFDDTGQYQCTVRNYLGTGYSSPVAVQVFGDPPTVDGSPYFYSTILGTNLTMKCNVSGIPAPLSVSWLRNETSGMTSIQSNSGKYDGGILTSTSLTIYNVADTDEGWYTCFATNLAGSSYSEPVYLNVSGDEPHVTIGAQEYTVIYGSNVTMGCFISSHPTFLSVLWQHNTSGSLTDIDTDEQRVTGGTIMQPSLTLTRVNFTHQGLYRCRSTNQVGTGFSNFTTLTVIGDIPNINVLSYSYNVIVTSNITIACNVSATPDVTSIKWQKGSTNETTDMVIDHVKYSGGTVDIPSLTIWHLENGDEGWYTCTAENLVGIGTSDQIYINVTGDIPMVTIPRNSYDVILGENVTIGCEISSHPPSTKVSWQRKVTGEFTPIIIDRVRFSGSSVANPSLTISFVTFEDDGEYICVVDNFVGEGESNSSILLVIGDPPTVSVSSTLYDAIEDDNVTLQCNTSGVPDVQSVSWHLNLTANNHIQTMIRYQTAFEPSLTILSVALNDAGLYTCTATNLAGTTRGVPIQLNVDEKCTKYVPDVSYSVIDCTFTNNTGTCEINCDSGFMFRDGSDSKIYQCTGRNQWVPPLPMPTCLETAPSTYVLVVNIKYRTSGIALFCKTAHNQAISNSYDAIIQQISFYCNNQFVSVGPIAVNSTNSTTSSFDITTTYFIVVGDSSTPKTTTDACGLLIENNIKDSLFFVYGSSLQCDKEASAITKTDGIVVSKESKCPDGFSLIDETNICISEIPQVGSTDTQYTSEVGSNVTLYCDIKSNLPISSIYWLFTPYGKTDQVAIQTNDSRYTGGTTQEASLTIKDVDFDDIGLYKCSAINEVGVGSGPNMMLSVITTVQDLPIVEVLKISYAVILGNNVTLDCSIKSDLLVSNVKWQKKVGNQFVDIIIDSQNYHGSTVSNPNLVMTGVRFSDRGGYICTATSFAGTGSSNISILSVNGDLPVVSVGLRYYTVQFGSNIMLQCMIYGVPTVTEVIWYRNDSGNLKKIDVMTPDYSGSLPNMPSLTIIVAKSIDEGWYTCTGTNLAGTTSSAPIYLNVTANKPVITNSQDRYDVIAGYTVKLQCSVFAYPPVITSTWTRNSTGTFRNVVTDGHKFQISGNSTFSLQINTVDLSDNGVYVCQSTNDAGTTVGAPIVLHVIGGTPTVRIDPTFSVLYGENVTLECKITSVPNLTAVSWKTDASGSLQDIDPLHAKYNGGTIVKPSLTLLNINFEDDGKYVCMGTNLLGTGSNITTLTVTGGVPSVYVSSTVYHVTIADNITLNCNASSSPDVISISWEKNRTGLSNRLYSGGTLSQHSLTLYNLEAIDGGWYVCTATNLVGTGKSYPIYLNVTGEEVCAPSVFPMISNGDVTCSDNSFLLCIVSCDSGYVTRDGNLTVNFRCENNVWSPPLPPKGCLAYVLPLTEYRLQVRYNFSAIAKYCLTSHEQILENLKSAFGQEATNVCHNNIFNTGIMLEIADIQSQTSGFTIDTVFTVRTRFNTVGKADRDLCRILLENRVTALSLFTYTSTLNCGSATSTVGQRSGSLLSSMDICSSGTTAVSTQPEIYCVSDVPSVVILKPSYIVENEDSVTIECIVESTIEIDNVYWIHNSSGEIKTIYGNSTDDKYSGSSPKVPSLTITSSDFSDEGLYTCIAVNDIGPGSSAAVFVDIVEKIRDLPLITSTSTTLQYISGSKVKLECPVAEKSYASIVYWQFVKTGQLEILQPFSFTDRYSGSTANSPSLTIHDATVGDSGSYTCFAVNILGVGRGHPIELVVKELGFSGEPGTGQSTSETNTLSCVKTFSFLLMFAFIGIVLLTACSIIICTFVPDRVSSFIRNVRQWKISEKIFIIAIEIFLSVVTSCALAGIVTVTKCADDVTGATVGLTGVALIPGIVMSALYLAFCCYIQTKRINKIGNKSNSGGMIASTSPVPEEHFQVKSWRPYETSDQPLFQTENEEVSKTPYQGEELNMYASTFKSVPLISKPSGMGTPGRQSLPPIGYTEYAEVKKKRRRRKKKKPKKESFDAMDDSHDEF